MSALDDWMAFKLWFSNFRHFQGRKRKRGRPSMDAIDDGLIAAVEKASERSGLPFQTLLKKNVELMHGGERKAGLREQIVDRIMKKRRQKQRE